MDNTAMNINEPTGPNVIRSASGIIAHAIKPLGADVTRTLVTEDVIKDVTAARKAAGLDP